VEVWEKMGFSPEKIGISPEKSRFQQEKMKKPTGDGTWNQKHEKWGLDQKNWGLRKNTVGIEVEPGRIGNFSRTGETVGLAVSLLTFVSLTCSFITGSKIPQRMGFPIRFSYVEPDLLKKLFISLLGNSTTWGIYTEYIIYVIYDHIWFL
jgi:hypothetical protein